jgi:hypothetical protein
VPLDEGQQLGGGGGRRCRQIVEPAEELALPQMPESELPDDERMRQDPAGFEQPGARWPTSPRGR